ncbi:MAG TPA: YCF48-related protein [Terriglobales bacterium]|nr:YCF48-related protein [Terriglobales bacterium]
MEALPKIVRQRLRSGAKPGGHPQPDLLTAFAEQTLTGRERTRVVEHLSRCEDCREVVFLAIPQPETVQIVEKVPSPAGWLSWPALRWGAAVACMAVVGTAVTLFHHDHARQALSQSSGSEQPQDPAAAPAVATSSDRVRDKELRQSPPASEDRQSDEFVAKAAPPERPSRNAMTATPRIPMQFSRSRQINGSETGALSEGLAASAPAAPSANLMKKTANLQDQVAASGNSPKVSDANETAEVQAAAQDIARAAVAGKDSPVPSDRALTSAQVSPSRSDLNGARYSSSAKKELAHAPAASSPRWMLAPGGILQRSFDGGKSWETIAGTDKTSFQAFSAVGSEVWAGGADGLLYHSSDAGLNWIRIRPQASGQPLTAAIRGVQFSDTQNGKVTTVNGETWTTSDAGKSWRRR